MDLGTVFKLSLYGLIAIVGVILGSSEIEGAVVGKARAELFLPFLSVPVVLCGYLITERKAKGLSPVWANSLGLVALMATAYQFNSENREGKLLAGTHLLLYVTWIVSFQQKTLRSYWFLMALGNLQLAIASVLTRSGWFGFSAIGYTFGAVWTLSIFSLWRAEQLFEEGHRKAIAYATSAGMPSISEVRGSVRHEDGTNWLTPRFVSGVLTMTVSALLVSAAFFAFIPRVWVGPDYSFQEERTPADKATPRTGLATSVKLGTLGPILESKERVFDMQLTSLVTGQLIRVNDYAELLGMSEPLFRGMVLSKYDKGRWTSERWVSNMRRWREMTHQGVQQDFRLEQNGTRLLFCLGRPLDVTDFEKSSVGLYEGATGVLFREDVGPVDYSVFTDLPEQQQSHFKLFVGYSNKRLYDANGHLRRCLEVPDELSELKQLAINVVDKERVRRNKMEQNSIPRELTALEMAEAIESYLRDSGEYRYSLEASIKDPKRDPVEDFLFNRRAGHCEYFATALALMMRAVGIPARVVSGFKGGIEHLDKREYSFEVQQCYSHLWVDAWVSPDEPEWTTFDATPVAARATALANILPKKSSVWSDMQSTFSGLWSENVLNMSLDRQERSIYKPLRELGYSLATFVQQLFTSPRAAFETLWELLSNRDQWFSIGGSLFGIAVCLVLAAFIWLTRKGGKWFMAWLADRARLRGIRDRRVVDFYERFAKVMQTQGLKREVTQTQREFAERIMTAHLPAIAGTDLEDVPRQISNCFYRVRFGDEDLTTEELDKMQLLLTKLEQAFQGRANDQ